MKESEFLKYIWEKQQKGYYCISSKIKDVWKDEFFSSIDKAIEKVKEIKNKGDVYFCITPLKIKKRIKDSVISSKFLYQDLDEVDPNFLDLTPTIAWESSPKRFQALWQLDKTIKDPKLLEKLNRKLCRLVKADKGSWILTKVLRIPGTYNYKYSSKPKVRLLWQDGEIYTKKQIRSAVAKLKPEREITDIKITDLNNEKISDKVRKLLKTKNVEVGTRSDTLWYIEHELAKAGFTVEQVYNIIRSSAWNKYRNRKDEHERLIHEISEVFKDETTGEPDKVKRAELIIENDRQFMSDISNYPGWLVKGFWTRKSHGIIAGEPKSFKSTLALDLALSVASGMPFLGEYEVSEHGPVLIIQNENAPWIMKDRLEKIRANKGLVGKIHRPGKQEYQINFPPALPLYYMNQQGFSLSSEEHKRILEETIVKIEPKLVILDPLYLMFEGDINSAKDLSPVLNWLLWLKEKYNLSLIIIHHWRKSQGATKRGGQRLLGSVTLHGWLESAWYLGIEGQEEENESRLDVSNDLNAPSATSVISLEREFRGAGVYPKIDISINIGEFGEPVYEVLVGKHRRKKTKINKFELSEDIINFLGMRDEPLSTKVMSEELGIARKTISVELKRLEIARMVESGPQGWSLTSGAEKEDMI